MLLDKEGKIKASIFFLFLIVLSRMGFAREATESPSFSRAGCFWENVYGQGLRAYGPLDDFEFDGKFEGIEDCAHQVRSTLLNLLGNEPSNMKIEVFDGTFELFKADGTKIECASKGPLKPYVDKNPDLKKYGNDWLKGKASIQQLRSLAPILDEYIEVKCARSNLGS